MALGNAMQMTARFDQAAAAFDGVIAADPNVINAAEPCLDAAKDGKDRRIAGSTTKSFEVAGECRVEGRSRVVLLTRGDYERGFADYELRAALPHFAERLDRTRERWDGSDPSGKTIVIINDQGMGDLIQFIRYAPLLADRGATVWVACPPALEPIAQSVRGVSGVIDASMPPLPDEMWTWESSLPALFKTTLDTVPADVPYIADSSPRGMASGPATRTESRFVGPAGR
jgi:hypothetical protein